MENHFYNIKFGSICGQASGVTPGDIIENRKQYILFFLTVFLILFVYLEAFHWLVRNWADSRAFSHGFLVPAILFYIIWIRKDLYKSLSQKPDYLFGSLILIGSAAMLIFGRVTPVIQAEAVSLLFFLPGMVLFVFGRDYLKALAFPLIYAQFLVPWMEEFMEFIQWPFQLISAQIGALILQIFGYSVYVNGIFIEMPNVTMKVAEACSGVHFLTGVAAFGLVLVYITQHTWKRAGLVLFLGGILTILANGVRVAMAGIEGTHFGAEMLRGPGHILRGSVVVWVGVAGVFIINWLVLEKKQNNGLRLYEKWKDDPTLLNSTKKKNSLERRPLLYFLGFLAVFGFYLNFLTSPEPIPLKRPLISFPSKLGEWQGKNSDWFRGDSFFPGADHELTRTYTNHLNETVNLYIAYFEYQNEGKRLITFHSKPLHESAEIISTGMEGRYPKIVNHAHLNLDKGSYESFFWYMFSFGTVADRYRAKLMPVADAFFHRKNNGAIVLVSLSAGEKDEKEYDEEILVSFLRLLPHELEKFFPFDL